MSTGLSILDAAARGDPQAAAELLPLVYNELRRLAAGHMQHERPGQTLNATALVHEAYVRLIGDGRADAPWDNHKHFFVAASNAMRRILVENARRKRRIKHGGGRQREAIDLDDLAGSHSDDQLIALDEALSKFAEQDPIKAQLIQFRFFGGFSNEEAAALLDISPATAKRHWRYARAWLHREIGGTDGPIGD